MASRIWLYTSHLLYLIRNIPHLIVSASQWSQFIFGGLRFEEREVIVFSKSIKIQYQKIRLKHVVEIFSCLSRYFSFVLFVVRELDCSFQIGYKMSSLAACHKRFLRSREALSMSSFLCASWTPATTNSLMRQIQKMEEVPVPWSQVRSPLSWRSYALYGKRPWCWERLRARGEGGNRGWDGILWMPSPTWMDISLGKLWEMVKDREAWHMQFIGLQRVGHNLATEQHDLFRFCELTIRFT